MIVGFIIWSLCAVALVCIGIYDLRSETPVGFWAGVKPAEVTDVKAYNRANGWMWIVFSLAMWASTIIGIRSMTVGGFVLIAVCLIGIPALMITYKNIWDKYRVRQEDA